MTRNARKTASRAAQGLWAQWTWDYRHEVVADSELTEAMYSDCSLVLYGDTRSNSVLAKVADRLPITSEPGAIVAGAKRYPGKGVGVRFIAPNPLAPDQYVVVQASTTAAAVAAGRTSAELIDILAQAVDAGNGWKRILQRCSPSS